MIPPDCASCIRYPFIPTVLIAFTLIILIHFIIVIHLFDRNPPPTIPWDQPFPHPSTMIPATPAIVFSLGCDTPHSRSLFFYSFFTFTRDSHTHTHTHFERRIHSFNPSIHFPLNFFFFCWPGFFFPFPFSFSYNYITYYTISTEILSYFHFSFPCYIYGFRFFFFTYLVHFFSPWCPAFLYIYLSVRTVLDFFCARTRFSR
ncbi:hypothetical protein M413DRAFT_326710 [Hebeloma cylindrosporum]|uniref:Uncharacterized protein n=1 Tax=Hebeloma cylindrosporum TaxID=76867 RepID=A0A0C3BUD4_HEBCY|nr:hypothetical protein M413DRAFT_326710 [Hebeloma cylindrosporum h7]